MYKDIRIDKFAIGDEKDVLGILSEAELLTEDLTIDKLKHFLVAKKENGAVIGAVGIELYQDTGLLRSLVIHPSQQGNGLGKQLIHELEALARQKGIRTLYLLTVTASDYFPKLGYEVTERSEVPRSIAETGEFKTLCPTSAVCLFKYLEPS